MKRLILIILVFSKVFILLGQVSIGFSLDYNKCLTRPYSIDANRNVQISFISNNNVNIDSLVNASLNKKLILEKLKDYKRNYDFVFGLFCEKSINELLTLEISLNMSVAFEEFSAISNYKGIDTVGDIIIGDVYSYKYSGASLGFILPINTKINIYKSKLYYTCGLNVCYERILYVGNYPTLDPEVAQEYNNKFLFYPKFAFGTQFGLEYSYKKIGFNLNFIQRRVTDYNYFSIGFGLKYYITGH